MIEEKIEVKADFTEPLFEMKITVSKNCSTFEVNILKPGYEIKYGDIIGYLEIVKHKYIWEQTGQNIEDHIKRTKDQMAEAKKLNKLKK